MQWAARWGQSWFELRVNLQVTVRWEGRGGETGESVCSISVFRVDFNWYRGLGAVGSLFGEGRMHRKANSGEGEVRLCRGPEELRVVFDFRIGGMS